MAFSGEGVIAASAIALTLAPIHHGMILMRDEIRRTTDSCIWVRLGPIFAVDCQLSPVCLLAILPYSTYLDLLTERA
eukprot:scaffold49309_cov48-Cyclotella_meneghiniana.AAC.5